LSAIGHFHLHFHPISNRHGSRDRRDAGLEPRLPRSRASGLARRHRPSRSAAYEPALCEDA
jgi:hypothetical protein